MWLYSYYTLAEICEKKVLPDQAPLIEKICKSKNKFKPTSSLAQRTFDYTSTTCKFLASVNQNIVLCDIDENEWKKREFRKSF